MSGKSVDEVATQADGQDVRTQDENGRSEIRGFAPDVEWDPEVWEYFTGLYGENRLEMVALALTRPPMPTCFRVNTLVISPQQVSDNLQQALDIQNEQKHQQHTKAGLSDNCAQIGIEAAKSAEGFLGPRRWTVRRHSKLSDVLIVDGQPQNIVDYTPACGREVVVDRRCGEAVLRGAEIFVPGVLGCSPKVEVGDEVCVSVAVEPLGSSSCAPA